MAFGLKSFYYNLKHVHNPFYRQTTPLFYDVNNENRRATEGLNSDKHGTLMTNLTYEHGNDLTSAMTSVLANGHTINHLRATVTRNDEKIYTMIPFTTLYDDNTQHSRAQEGNQLEIDVKSVADSAEAEEPAPPAYEDCL